MSEWQPIETAPTNGQPNPAALLSAMQILPLADACALVAMSPEHRAAFVGAEAWKVVRHACPRLHGRRRRN